MEIRPATAADREAIRTVAREAWHDTYDDLEAETIDATIDEWYGDDSFDDVLEQPGTAVLVAAKSAAQRAANGSQTQSDGEVVGFAHGVVHEDEGDILRMYVHPDHQDEGIGTALHERLRDDLEDFNMNRMRAMDLESNTASREFYEERGFERTDEATVELGDDEYTEAVYTLEL